MDFERAKEIYNSPDTIEVLYNGSSVWIESLDPRNKTARVISNGIQGKEATVPVNDLEENTDQ
jgi:small acid-soluble spore protein H (minor)